MKDVKISDLQKEIDVLNEKVGVKQCEKAKVDGIIQSMQMNIGRREKVKEGDDPVEKCEDIIILHASPLKPLTDCILKNEGLTVQKVWARTLGDAKKEVGSMLDSPPRAVLLHSPTNDLQNRPAEKNVTL